MGLFTTKTRRTYHRKQANRGWSTTTKASTKAKRWFRRGRKKLWRKAKQRVRRQWRKQYRKTGRYKRQRQVARSAQQFQRHHSQVRAGGYQVGPDGAVSYQPATTAQAAGPPPPPPDGAMATCRRCSHPVQYTAYRERWEHTAGGNAACFHPH